MSEPVKLKYCVGDKVFSFDDSWIIKQFQIGFIKIGNNDPIISSKQVVYIDTEGEEHFDLWTFKSYDDCKISLLNKLRQFYLETINRVEYDQSQLEG